MAKEINDNAPAADAIQAAGNNDQKPEEAIKTLVDKMKDIAQALKAQCDGKELIGKLEELDKEVLLTAEKYPGIDLGNLIAKAFQIEHTAEQTKETVELADSSAKITTLASDEEPAKKHKKENPAAVIAIVEEDTEKDLSGKEKQTPKKEEKKLESSKEAAKTILNYVTKEVAAAPQGSKEKVAEEALKFSITKRVSGLESNGLTPENIKDNLTVTASSVMNLKVFNPNSTIQEIPATIRAFEEQGVMRHDIMAKNADGVKEALTQAGTDAGVNSSDHSRGPNVNRQQSQNPNVGGGRGK
jgi:hypothetical protein